MKKLTEQYSIKVIGESESPFRGTIPESIDKLTHKPSKDTASLIYQAAKAQVESCLQKGDVAAAWEAIDKYKEQEHEYSAPLNCFRKDAENGGAPYLAGHMFFGAFRDSAKYVYEIFYQKQGDKKPAQEHLKKFMTVRPYRVFMFSPTVKEGNRVTEASGVTGQQPSPRVMGFAQYEFITPPFQFGFKMVVQPKGPFVDFLSDPEKVMDNLHKSVLHGIGACRGLGYGMWRIIDARIETGV